MTEYQEYRFKIDAYTPDTIPMARLTEYMADLAAMLGEAAHVHFKGLESGSTVIVSSIESEAVPKVRTRIRSVRQQDAPKDVLRAYQSINHRLAQDNGTGSLIDDHEAEIIPFPGVGERTLGVIGPFRQPGTIDGVILRMGGKGDWIPMIVESEGREISGCRVRRELALALRQHLMETPLRLSGEGRWLRDAHGVWTMDRFFIQSYSILDDAPLHDVVKQLRSVEGAGWDGLDDPLGELHRLRYGPDDPH